MTTIAYRDGVLAADSMENLGAEIVLPSRTTKVHRLRDGRLFAWTGDAGFGQRVMDALNRNASPPDFDGKGCAIVIDQRGRAWTFEQNAMVRERAPYVARGSGKSFAYGAMAMGASARQAVRIASRFDPTSGGGVKALQVKR